MNFNVTAEFYVDQWGGRFECNKAFVSIVQGPLQIWNILKSYKIRRNIRLKCHKNVWKNILVLLLPLSAKEGLVISNVWYFERRNTDKLYNPSNLKNLKQPASSRGDLIPDPVKRRGAMQQRCRNQFEKKHNQRQRNAVHHNSVQRALVT